MHISRIPPIYDGLLLVQEQIRLRRIGVLPVAPLQKSQRHQRVKKIPRRPRMQPQPPCHRLQASGRFANSVNTPISTALNSVFEAQNPKPICMMFSGVGCSPTSDLLVTSLFEFRFWGTCVNPGSAGDDRFRTSGESVHYNPCAPASFKLIQLRLFTPSLIHSSLLKLLSAAPQPDPRPLLFMPYSLNAPPSCPASRRSRHRARPRPRMATRLRRNPPRQLSQQSSPRRPRRQIRLSRTPILPSAHTIVAVTGNIIHGFSTTAPSHEPDLPNHGELTALYVDPHSWGLGVGVALVSAARAHLVSLGLRKAYLFTLVDNLRAQRFYKNDQWTPDGLRRTDTVWGGRSTFSASSAISSRNGGKSFKIKRNVRKYGALTPSNVRLNG